MTYRKMQETKKQLDISKKFLFNIKSYMPTLKRLAAYYYEKCKSKGE